MKVRDSVVTPHHGWGDVDRTSVGTLRVLPPSGYETLVIDFPEHKSWSGLLSEVEVVPDDPSDEVSSVESAMAEPTSSPGRLPCVFKLIATRRNLQVNKHEIQKNPKLCPGSLINLKSKVVFSLRTLLDTIAALRM